MFTYKYFEYMCLGKKLLQRRFIFWYCGFLSLADLDLDIILFKLSKTM